MRLYSTLTNEKTELDLEKEKEFRMLVCGPTVQDNVHLGHAKTYLAFDVLARWLLRKGIPVYFLMNITDVDDKIFDRAKKENVPYTQVAERFFKDFVEDLESLNIATVSKYARVSKFVNESASLVLRLLEAGKAYRLGGNVYFDTSKADHFGKLSHQSEFQLKMKIIDAAPGKRNSTDFLLWRSIPDAQEGIWETPAGIGRPGWHIQDTAIAFEEFQGPYDLHGGATELIFPHHESELAQDEALSGEIPFVKVWMHTGLLLKDGEKMSKSLGNVMTIREALRNCDADLIRAFFLKRHYRDSYDFSPGDLLSSKDSLDNVMHAGHIVPRPTRSTQEPASPRSRHEEEFNMALDDDLDTPKAMRALQQLSKEIVSRREDKDFLDRNAPAFWRMVETLGFRLF